MAYTSALEAKISKNRLLMNFEIEHSGIKSSMLKALGNVVLRHLLDRRFNLLLELRETYARTTILANEKSTTHQNK